jgi:hypothetical protein
MAMDADRRERLVSLTTAYPLPASAPDAVASPAGAAAPIASTAAGATTGVSAVRADSPLAAEGLAPALAGQPAGTAFGVDRRAPRGAFLWPSASVAALGLNAAAPEGQQAMSVAALELLAARAVAELGTFAALEDRSRADERVDAAGSAGAVGSADAAVLARSIGLPGVAGAEAAAISSITSGSGEFGALAPRTDGTSGFAPGALGDPGERDVLAAANELVPAARRARFDALYVALGQSPAGRTWSPAARAARALALAGQTDAAPIAARERAAMAWDVLPVVYASEGLFDGEIRVAADGSLVGASAGSLGTGGTAAAAAAAAARAGRGFAAGAAPAAEWLGGYAGPGLGALSARAGEALGSYVAPFAQPAPAAETSESSSSRDRGETGAVLRAPTAMQELVRTGRPSGQHGGGETEIPPWFEAAARKMFESQGTISENISIAELTLVTAAPSAHIAASSRAAQGSASLSPSPSAAPEKSGAAGPNAIDVEATAQEIYRYIIAMMDAARARNGEPYL